jgi:hypothetical protein
MKRLFILLPISLLLAGCASATLKLNLDIYKEDPFESAPISEAKLIQIQNGIDVLERESATLADNRKKLGDTLFNTYKEILYVITMAKRPNFNRNDLESETKGFQVQLKEYKETIETKLREINALAESARNILFPKCLKGDEKSREPSELNVQNAVKKFEKAVGELGGPLGTHFEATLIQNWPTVAKSASEENLRNLFKDELTPPELKDLRVAAEKYNGVIDGLKKDGYNIPEKAIKDLNTGLENLKTPPSPSALSNSLVAIVKAGTTLSPAIGLSDRGETELGLLVKATTLLSSQIDRLQDPADPVWRIVSAPENEYKWNKDFSETYFYAEGNSSVVVVRDTPISFRQQRGANNPTALIQNQLVISRAIGNAAISIAAATTGVPIKLPSDTKSTASPPTNGNTATESEVLARRKAVAEEQLRLRKQALSNLRNNLISIREEFRLKDGKKTLGNYPELKSRLEVVLKAHQAFFKSSKSNN